MMYLNPGMRDDNDRRDDLKTLERKGTRERPRLETVEKNMENLLSVDEVAGVLGPLTGSHGGSSPSGGSGSYASGDTFGYLSPLLKSS